MEVKRKYPAHSKRPAAPGVATLLPFNSSAATAHPSPTPRRLSRRLDRKSTRLNSKSLRHLVCRLLLEKKKKKLGMRPRLCTAHAPKAVFEDFAHIYASVVVRRLCTAKAVRRLYSAGAQCTVSLRAGL